MEEEPQAVDVNLQVRIWGRLRKATSVPVAETWDNGKIPLVEEGTEPTKEPVVAGSPTIEELDQQVNELLTHPFVSKAVHEGEGDKDEWG
ncbi:hypothetical protein Dimus_015631 [Dionaea muscipula]